MKTTARKPEEEVVAKMAVRVDADDPEVNVKALITVCQNMCEGMGKSPEEGALMLCTAAAAILDGNARGRAMELGPDYAVDLGHLIQTYMQIAAAGWNMSAAIFRGVEVEELGSISEADTDEVDRGTLQ